MRLTIPTERQRETLLVLVRAFDRQIVADALHVDIPGLARALAGRPVHAGSPLLSVTSTAWDRCRAVARNTKLRQINQGGSCGRS